MKETEDARRLEAEKVAAEAREKEKAKEAIAAEENAKREKLVEEQLESARTAIASGLTREAVASLKGTLLLFPDEAAVEKELAPLQKGIAKLDEAQALLQGKRYWSAIKAFDEFQTLYPKDAEGKRERARAAKELQGAHGIYQNLNSIATLARRNRQYEKAADFLTRAVATFPEGKEAPAALAAVTKELDAAKKNHDALLIKGDALFAAERFDDAEDAYRAAIAVFPEGPDAAAKLRDTLARIDQANLQLVAEERARREQAALARERARQLDRDLDRERDRELDRLERDLRRERMREAEEKRQRDLDRQKEKEEARRREELRNKKNPTPVVPPKPNPQPVVQPKTNPQPISGPKPNPLPIVQPKPNPQPNVPGKPNTLPIAPPKKK
jgi:tetratricopeptide (TPR) repeat protein